MIPKQPEGHPLEQHLDEEEDGEDHIDNLQDEDEFLVVLQVDVFEAEGQAAEQLVVNRRVVGEKGTEELKIGSRRGH